MDNGLVMPAPVALRVHPMDNIGIAVRPEGAKPGELLTDGVGVLETTPQGQKLAVAAIEVGEAIVR